ncbi:hypothetical protein [Stutzerimonas kunmingensis]|uniref:hypothetical protein n=1 Tax=Stutzerimonas kunmingensis TaxID=1211807 RepID=UPI000CE4FF11|nr:hypothetical protein [Stutzerimonas kunmingensis]
MARRIPVRSQCQFDTPGERRFALKVLSVARAFASELLSGQDAGEDGLPSSSSLAPATAMYRPKIPL